MRLSPSLILMSLTALLAGAGARGGTILLQDNFNDNSLDPAKWKVVLPGIPGTPGVFERDGHVELLDRGQLVTAQGFDPSVVGPITISGTWTFNTSSTAFQQEDRMTIVLRTDAVPGGPPYGDVNGVGFQLQMHGVGNPGFMSIFDTVVGDTAFVPIEIHNGDTFGFTIRDDGFNVSFSVRPVGGQETTITSSSTAHFGDFIDFHNRMRAGNLVPEVSYLDDVVITGANSVPEPNSLVLAATGILGAVVCGARRRGHAGRR